MKKIAYAIFAVLLSACDQSSQEANNAESNSDAETQLEKTLSTQLDALEKSKQVEKGLQDSVDKRNQEMEKRGI